MNNKVENEKQTVLFESMVLCDDIRLESTGKILLIGVYSDVIQVPKLPLQLRSLAFAIKAKAFSIGRFSFSVELLDPQANSLLKAEGEIGYDGELGRLIWLPVVTGPVLLPTEGVYSVAISLAGNAPVREAFHVRKAVAPAVQLTQSRPN